MPLWRVSSRRIPLKTVSFDEKETPNEMVQNSKQSKDEYIIKVVDPRKAAGLCRCGRVRLLGLRPWGSRPRTRLLPILRGRRVWTVELDKVVSADENVVEKTAAVFLNVGSDVVDDLANLRNNFTSVSYEFSQ
jgi:hypothetical protein